MRRRKGRQVWEVVSRERKRKKGTGEGIEMGDWVEHFKRQLGGVDERVRIGCRGRREGEEMDITREEVERVIGKLKEGKAVRGDETPREVWKYGGERLRKFVWDICNGIWRGKEWIEDWSEGLIVPIRKKGTGESPRDYRGVSLAPALYKVYTMILGERLEEEVERKGIIPQNQTGFRKGMGTVDNIYALNYLVGRQLSKKKGGLVACFVDLKAAFDSVDREGLREALRERGVRERLVERCMDVLRETRNRVRVGGEVSEVFWTGKGVRQGCPLSPGLFNILIADLEEYMRKGCWGGVRLLEGKVYTLAYADDLVLLAEEEEGMRSMLARLERYIKGKRLEVNREKTKILRFRRGGGRKRKVRWCWEGRSLEEVSQYRYLGYVFQRNGGQEEQVKDRMRRGMAAMGQVWGIGKRKFGRDWGKRIWMFDALIWAIMGYGSEIWGWRERRQIEIA